MVKEESTNSLANFTFDNDNEDWSFGENKESTTSVKNVVSKVKSGTTINEVDDDDDDTPVNLNNPNEVIEDEEDKDFDKEDIEKGKPKKIEPVVKKIEPVVKKKDGEEEEGEEVEEDIDFEKESSKNSKNKSVVKKDEVVADENDSKFYNTWATELKEKGIFEHVEIPKDKDLTEEEFLELHDEEIEARAAESLDAFTENMDQDAKDFIKYKKRGGDTKTFIETYYGSGIDYSKFDAEDEFERDQLNRFYIQNVEGLEGEDLDDRLQGLKDSGKDKTKAIEWAKKLEKIEEKERKDLLDKQEEDIAKAKEGIKKFNDQLIATLSKTDVVNDFPINKKLSIFFTKSTVKVGKDKYIPAFQAKLADVLKAKDEKSRKNLLLLGTLLENDFDFSAIVPKVQTKIVKAANKTLQRAKTGQVNLSNVTGNRGKSLADMFGDDDKDD